MNYQKIVLLIFLIHHLLSDLSLYGMARPTLPLNAATSCPPTTKQLLSETAQSNGRTLQRMPLSPGNPTPPRCPITQALVNKYGTTKTLLATETYQYSLTVIQNLHARGAMINCFNGETPLLVAATAEHADAMVWFIAQGVNINLKSRTDQMNTLGILSYKTDLSLVRKFLKAVFEHSSVEALQKLITVPICNSIQQTFFHVFAKIGDVALLVALIKKANFSRAQLQALINKPDINSITPLHRAALFARSKVVQAFLDLGANPMARIQSTENLYYEGAKNGDTPLDILLRVEHKTKTHNLTSPDGSILPVFENISFARSSLNSWRNEVPATANALFCAMRPTPHTINNHYPFLMLTNE
jgi:ankyrin repeat protein